MNTINRETTIQIPLVKVFGITGVVITLAGFWFNLTAQVYANQKDITKLIETTQKHNERIKDSEVDMVEIRTKLVSIEALLVDIKSQIK